MTSDKYLGNSSLEITYYEEKCTGKDIFLALKHAFSKVATHVASLKPAYEETNEFYPKRLKDVLKDKKSI